MSQKTRQKPTKSFAQTQLIRNCTIPPNSGRRTPQTIVHGAAGDLPVDTDAIAASTNRAKDAAFAKPVRLTTIASQQEAARIQNAPVVPSKSLQDLGKVAQEYVNSQASHKLNFFADSPVFKNLQPINVNDSVLELQCPGPRKRKPFVHSSNRDPEPVFSDYLQPIERLGDHHIRVDDLVAGSSSNWEGSSLSSVGVNYSNVCELLDRLNCED